MLACLGGSVLRVGDSRVLLRAVLMAVAKPRVDHFLRSSNARRIGWLVSNWSATPKVDNRPAAPCTGSAGRSGFRV